MRAEPIDLVRALADLEGSDELHEARLLMLLHAFSKERQAGEIEGLTKLAKLDFLLRYPTLLERALKARGESVSKVRVQDHERNNVESRMIRYRFGPWDHRYRRFINLLVGKGLARTHVVGRTVNVSLTDAGLLVAERLASMPAHEDLVRRAQILRTAFDIGATNLKNFVYDTFPELTSLRMNEAIEP
jgi:hypothetical protein